MKTRTNQNSVRLPEWLLPAVILAVTFLAFSPALKSGFINWDDDVNLTANPFITDLTWENIRNIFTHTVIGGYTPLTTLSFALEHALFGLNPLVYHLNNILLHLACTALVFLLVRRLGFGLVAAAVAAALFGIHPMRVESVAWITERKDVLYGLFFLISMLMWVRFRESGKRVHYLISLAVFILSLLSKIQAVTLPLALIMVDFWIDKRFSVKQLINKAPFLALSLAMGIAGVYFLSQRGSLETDTVFPFVQRLFIGTYSLLVYLVKVVVPWPLSAIYPYPEKLTFLHYASILFLAGIVWLIVKSGKYRVLFVFSGLFFLLNIVFVLQVVGAGHAYLADRFTYIPYLGLFILAGWGVAEGVRRFPKAEIAMFCTLGILALASISGTWLRTRDWFSSETLFTDVIRKYPDVAMAHNNLGIHYSDEGKTEKAIASYSRAIELNPGGWIALNNRGEAYFNRGEAGKALEDVNRALELRPDYVNALTNRGAILGSTKEFDKALEDLDKALKLEPGNQKALSNRTLVYYSQGRFEEAIRDASEVLRLNPQRPEMYNHRGLCYSRTDRNREALADFTEAIRLNPSKGLYYRNRSYLYNKTGDRANALKDILKAEELGTRADPEYVRMLKSQFAI